MSLVQKCAQTENDAVGAARGFPFEIVLRSALIGWGVVRPVACEMCWCERK